MQKSAKSLVALALFVSGIVATLQSVEFKPDHVTRITFTVSSVLNSFHYSQSPLRRNDEVSLKFLNNYIEALDPNRMVFLQSDVDEFRERFGKKLDDYSLRGQTQPAFVVFKRYLDRLEQRVNTAYTLIESDFDFEQEEDFVVNRKDLPWPADHDEATDTWRKSVKSELLSDLLTHESNIAEKENKEGAEEGDEDDRVEEDSASNKPYDDSELREKMATRYRIMLKNRQDFENSDILDMYLSGLSAAYDPHSRYFSPIAAQNFDIRTVKNYLTGIGAELRSEEGYTTIQRLLPGGPAIKSRELKAGDRIIKVAQGDGEPEDVVEKHINKVVELIRGEIGTTVKLTIIPGDAPDERRVISLVRDRVNIEDQQASAELIDFNDAGGNTTRYGVIDLPGFYEKCSEHVEVLIERLTDEGIQGIVLDLRHNGGGLLPEAVELAGLFFKKGPVVQVDHTRRAKDILSDNDSGVAYSGPLVVLVNNLSASASEIVAAALQDYGRAVVVGGETTHGKGTVQTLIQLKDYISPRGIIDDPGKLKFTVSKFFRINGYSTQKDGVTPDIILPSIYDHMEIGEASLDNALDSSQIDPLKYESLNRIAPYAAALRERSKARVEASQEFKYINEDINRLIENREKKTVSLNAEVRRQEKKERRERADARIEERRERDVPERTIYEITLKDIAAERPLAELTREAKAKAEQQKEEDAEVADPEDDETEDEDEEDSGRLLDPYVEESLFVLQDLVELKGLKVADQTKKESTQFRP